jgi:hypothetical protein
VAVAVAVAVAATALGPDTVTSTNVKFLPSVWRRVTTPSAATSAPRVWNRGRC